MDYIDEPINFDDECFQLFIADNEQEPLAKKSSDPSDPSYEGCDLTSGGERIKTDRRDANKKLASRACLNVSDRTRFADTMNVDNITIPMHGDVIDLNRISMELGRTGKEARGLSTLVLSRASLAENVAFGIYETYGNVLSNDLTVFEKVVNIVHLVGHVIPVFGQMRKPPTTGLGEKSRIYNNHRPITSEYHSFAFEPVLISTTGDGPGDSGEIVAQGIIVSNKGINFPLDDNRRLTLGRKSEFEESLCYVLITHVYTNPFISYASIGPPSTKKMGDKYGIINNPQKNFYDHIFRWTDFMINNTHLRGCGVSLFGFTDLKQTGKDITRRMFPWSVTHATETLEWFRTRNLLDNFLIESPMTTVRRASGREDIPSGMDMRRFLLAELLLSGTPLEKMLSGERVEFDFAPTKIEGGGPGLYRRLHAYSFAKMLA